MIKFLNQIFRIFSKADPSTFELSKEKILIFLKLQQSVLDIPDSSRLLDQFLPKVLHELNLIENSYIYASAIFVDAGLKIKRIFFADQTNGQSSGLDGQNVIREENLFQKGKEWEMKVMYGDAAVVSDVSHLINPSYSKYQQIHSLLILPIMHKLNFSGVLILASPKSADEIDLEEIEFGKMITRLCDLAFRLQDTEESLTAISRQVYEMNAKLHQLDKLKDDFVSVASHELRTPMTAIRSYAWMALHKSDIPISQKLERYLYRIMISTERLINLVNDMLNVSRIEAGRIEISPRSFDLLEFTKDIIDEIRPKADEKRIEIVVLEHKIPEVFADLDKIHEVILNLLGNSLKFTYPGGSITIDFFVNGDMVETSITDNGSGISREDLNKLFRKFGRLDNSYISISTSGGTGLGLYISKSLVERMGGKIWARSDGVDKGATFTFSLPIATEEILKNADKYKIKPQGEIKPLEPVVI